MGELAQLECGFVQPEPEPFSLEGGRIEVDIASFAESLDVMVSDTGPSIPDALREGLFQRPFTVGGTRRSGGLGLRIMYRILELHGRSISLRDRPGSRAVFSFSVPATSERLSVGQRDRESASVPLDSDVCCSSPAKQKLACPVVIVANLLRAAQRIGTFGV